MNKDCCVNKNRSLFIAALYVVWGIQVFYEGRTRCQCNLVPRQA